MQAGRGATVARRAWAGAVAGLVVGADQLTKHLIVRSIPHGDRVTLIDGWLDLIHIRNTGAAFGLLRGYGGLFALAAVVGVVVFGLLVLRDPTLPVAVGGSLIAGGAIGNLLDRLFRGPVGRGGVVDFFDLSFWPTFNVADSAITVGAIVLLVFGVGERASGADTGDDARSSDPS